MRQALIFGQSPVISRYLTRLGDPDVRLVGLDMFKQLPQRLQPVGLPDDETTGYEIRDQWGQTRLKHIVDHCIVPYANGRVT